MSDEELDPLPPDGVPDEGATVPKSELQKAIAKRQQLKQQLAETTAKLAEYEAKDREAEKERLKAAEDWGELEKQLSAERDAARAELDSFRIGLRRTALVDAVANATGKSASRDSLETLMAGAEALGRHKDLDWAPEVLNEKAIEKFVRTLKKDYPDFFATQARGGTPGAIGQPIPTDDDPEAARFRNMGKRYSTRIAHPRD